MLLLVELQLVIVKLHFRCFEAAIGIEYKTFQKVANYQCLLVQAHRWKAFNYGQASAIVNLSLLLSGALILVITPILPYALALSCMIFVVVEELIPDSQSGNNTDLATLSLMIGFTIMMILDVALG